MEATTFLTGNKTQIQDILSTGNIHYALQCAFEEKLLVNFEYTNLQGIPSPANAATAFVDKILYRGETVCKTFLRLLQDSKLTDVFPGLKTLPWPSPATTATAPTAPSTTYGETTATAPTARSTTYGETTATAPTARSTTYGETTATHPTAPSTTYAASRPAVAQVARISSQPHPSVSTQSACSVSTQPAARSGGPAIHFVDLHRPSLIQRVTSVEPILDVLLDEGVLSSEAYSTVRSKSTRTDKMRELYKLLSCYGPKAKDIFYRCLQENERYLLEDLRQHGPSGDEGTQGRRETPRAQPRVAAASVPAAPRSAAASEPAYRAPKSDVNTGRGRKSADHFVDRHRYRLVNGVTTVDHILDLLLSERVLSQYAYDKVRASSTPQEKMRELISFMNSTRAKDAFYRALQSTDPVLFRDLLNDCNLNC